MTLSEYIQLVVDVATNEIGYLEKASNSKLDSKTANAGSANYTKYGRDMHNLYPSVMDFPAYWCDAFVDWCFQKAYGVSNAKGLLGGNFNDYTVASAQLYKNKKAWYTSNPKVGDQIFFKNSSRICHTGLVVKVTSTTVTTIEGNTSSASGVVANGGCVRKKTYSLSYSGIAGYGRPAYAKFYAKKATSNSSSTPSLNKTIKWNGVVNSDALNVRTDAGKENAKCSFSPLKKGVTVGVCDSKKASDGSTWYYIKYNGKYGFVHSSYIKKKTSTKVVKYKTTSNLNLRSVAGVINKDNVLCVIPKGEIVTYKNKYKTIDGVKWYYVTYDGKTGYVSSKYLKKE